MSQSLVNAIIAMREEDALKITKELIEQGTDPFEVLATCGTAMETIGDRFEKGEAFIPELILAGEMLKQITDFLKPLLGDGKQAGDALGTFVLGTVEGDIHDIAKDIVAFVLEINGFNVVDLGVDVPPAKFVETVKETGAKIVGLSGFLTMAYEPMKLTVEALKDAGLDDVKVIIGGGQVDDQIREYTGADAFGTDAMTAVKYAKQWN